MGIIKVDDKKCTACRTCEVACSLENTNAVHPKYSKIRVYVKGDRYIPVIAGSFHESEASEKYTGVVENCAGECTFCLACVKWCLTGALTVASESLQGGSK